MMPTRMLVVLSLSLLAVAAEVPVPEVTVAVDVAGLRQMAPHAQLTQAWAESPAWAALRERLDQAAQVDRAWPPLTAVLDQSQSVVGTWTAAWAWSAAPAPAAWAAWAAARPVAVAPGAAMPAEPVRWTWQATAALARWQAARSVLPLVGWQQATATVQGAWRVQDGAWAATTTVTTTATLPLHGVDVHAADAGGLLAVATVMDPHVLAATLAGQLPSGHTAFLEDRLGMPLAAVAARLTGEIVLRIEPGEIVPAVILVLGLQPEAGLGDALVTAVGDSFRGQPTTVPGTTKAVRLDTPVGPWHAVTAPGRLVVTSDVALVADWLQRPIASPASLVVLAARADVPALVRRFLPLALAHGGGMPLTEDALPGLLATVRDVALAQVQAGAGLAEGLAPGAHLTIHHASGATRTLALSDEVRSRLGTLLGAHPADAVAVYAPVRDEDRVEVVVRTAEGWLVTADVQRGFTTPVTVEAMTRRLRDLGTQRLVLGRPLADLDTVTRPLVPRLDRACLPPSEQLAQAAAPWEATVRTDPTGFTLEDRGLPLLNTLLFALSQMPAPAPVRAAGMTEL